MDVKKWKIRKPDDFHCHLREGEMLIDVFHHTVKHFKRALVMPNIVSPVLTGEDAISYQEYILFLLSKNCFEPLMTIQITKSTTKKIVREAFKLGVIAGKLYPEGVTNSKNGVKDFE